jgi:hypothetical protein
VTSPLLSTLAVGAPDCGHLHWIVVFKEYFYRWLVFFLIKQEGRTPTGLLLKAEGKAKIQKAS